MAPEMSELSSQANQEMRKYSELFITSNPKRQKAGQVWRSMARELWGARELIGRFIYRDISVRYRQSILGHVWALVLPLTTVVVFAFLTSRRVIPIGEPPFAYPAFALWNLVVWQLFSGLLMTATHSLVSAGPLVTKVNFPKETLVISSLGQPLFDFLIKMALVVVVFLKYDVTPEFGAIAVPLILLFIFFLALGAGFFLAILNLVMRDVGNIVGIVATFGMFVAPVLYPPPVKDPFYLVNILNPVSPLLIATQDLIVFGELRHGDIFFVAALFSLLLFFSGWRVFRIVIHRVTERA